MTLSPALSQGRGSSLAVRRFPATDPWATLLIAGAMGVRQDFYEPLARYFAENGIHVVTFDYRGMGFSRSGGLRDFEADVSTWAERDIDAMLGEAQAMAPALPLLFLGHSLGGQLLGVVPGKALRMVGDLPRGVAWQWRRWCLNREYLLSEGEEYRKAFSRTRVPIRGYSFEDDDIVTKAAIDHLHSFYGAAEVERRHVSPREVGVGRIGHFGYFAERSRDTLWSESLAWLRARLA